MGGYQSLRETSEPSEPSKTCETETMDSVWPTYRGDVTRAAEIAARLNVGAHQVRTIIVRKSTMEVYFGQNYMTKSLAESLRLGADLRHIGVCWPAAVTILGVYGWHIAVAYEECTPAGTFLRFTVFQTA